MSNSRVPIHQRRRDSGQTIILVAVALVSLLAIAALQFPVLFCELEKMRLAMLNLENSDPNHYLLPADLSRHTKSTDPLLICA